MKLYLSSYRTPNLPELLALIGKPAEAIKVAVIPNAKDYYAKRAWEFKVDSYLTYFKELGLQPEVVDLRDFSEPNDLKQAIKKFDLIWVCGGNTFCLRYEMKRSGFETIIRELLEGGAAYGGDSAGALVAGPDLRGVESADVPEFAEEIIWKGLGLVSFTALPHVDNAEFSQAIEDVRRIQAGNEIIELADNEAVIVDGENLSVVTGI